MSLYSEIVVTPSIYVSPVVDVGELMIANLDEELLKQARREQAGRLASGVEAFIRQMVASCAVTTISPIFQEGPFPTAKALKSHLSPSARKRLSFVDGSQRLWSAVFEYFKPIRTAKTKRHVGNSRDSLNDVIWATYLLVLAAKRGSEVVLNPSKIAEEIDRVRFERRLGAEGLTRLAIVEGLFRSYREQMEVPGLRFRTHASAAAIRERIDEVIEDSYLLEASKIRRFFGLGANVLSLKRDLRVLTRFIAKSRPWAKGMISAGKVSGHLGSAASLEALLEQLGGATRKHLAPLCIEPSHLRLAIASSKGSDVWTFGRVHCGFMANTFRGREDAAW